MAAESYNNTQWVRWNFPPNNTQWKTWGKPVFEDETKEGVHRIGKLLSWHEFMHLPMGFGGRAGVLPWYPATVLSRSGESRTTNIVRLGVSNHTYVSDFGGGFNNEFGPFVGLAEELKQEAGQAWKRVFLKMLARQNECLFLSLEQYPTSRYRRKSPPIPLEVLILLPLSAEALEKMEENPFIPTPEIRAVMDRTIEQFHDMVDNYPTVGNDGIRQYALFREKAAKRLDAYFQRTAEDPLRVVEESLLRNDQVGVLLENGKTVVPFSHIIRENRSFSANAEEGWKIRKKYGVHVMKGKSPFTYHTPRRRKGGLRMSYRQKKTATKRRYARQ